MTDGLTLTRENPELAPEIMAAFGQVIAQLDRPAESATDAIHATAAHRLAGTDLGPLTDRALPEAPAGPALAPAVTVADLQFRDERLVGIARKHLRGSVVSIWQIRDPSLRAIAAEASGLDLDPEFLTHQAVLATLQHLSEPEDLERARRDLDELFALGAGARLRGSEPLDPRADRVLIRHGLQTGNVAAIAAGLLAASLPEDIGPRILRLGARLKPTDLRVTWIAQRGVDALGGAVSRKITASLHDSGSIGAHLDPYLHAAGLCSGSTGGRGIAPAALMLADLPDDPRLPPLVLALQLLDGAGKLEQSPEDLLVAAVRHAE